MGSGKSKVVVDLIVNEGFRLTIICCPCSVRGVWRREFKRWGTENIEVVVLDKGTTAQKAEHFGRCLKLARLAERQLVVVVNYETAWRDPLGKMLMAAVPNLWVCDESHRAKAPGGKASRYLQRAGVIARRKLCLTGTPMPHSPLDIYAQFRFLDPSIFGTSYTSFRARYAVTDPMFPSKVHRWLNLDELHERIAQITYRVTSEDANLDLPSLLHEVRYVALSPAARKLYDELEEELIASLDPQRIVVTPNALVKALRLQQIASGYVPTTDPETDEETITHLGDWKADALYDLLEDLPTTEPVVVFCRFRADLDAVMEAAARTGRRYGELSGRRHDISPEATMLPDVDLLGVQIQSGGVGIDLTRACYCVFFNQTWSLGEYDQAVARLNRPGQTRPMRFYHLLAARTIDEKMRWALENKRTVIEAVLNGLVSPTPGGDE